MLRNLDWMNDLDPVALERLAVINATRKLQDSENETKAPTGAADVVDFSSGVGNPIYRYSAIGEVEADPSPQTLPLWQESPTFGLGSSPTNWNIMNYPSYAPHATQALESKKMTLGGIQTAPRGGSFDENVSTRYFASILSVAAGELVEYVGDPMSTVFVPVFAGHNDTDSPVAIMLGVFAWASYFENLLTENFPGVTVVLENSCDGPFTYKVVGTEVVYIGPGDLHLSKFDSMMRRFDLNTGSSAKDGPDFNQYVCSYSLSVWPSQALFDEYITNLPIFLTTAVLLVFALASGTFFLYNQFVEQRQNLVMNQAVQSTAIVSSLFPATVRDRLLNDQNRSYLQSGKKRLKSFLADGDDEIDTEPIADLFPNATVFVCDISGFTPWSSSRDPSQIFILLQTIYQAFDVIAKRYRVFKVETVGDRYLAVAGLPEKDERHYVTMSKFACECLAKFAQLTKRLEQTLGPDTGDLGLRVGLHSGPVTAGVLRGERSRFQLFGDTVATAARMENSGVANKIHLSSATAQLLVSYGMGSWVSQRLDNAVAHGLGFMDTFWLNKVFGRRSPSLADGSRSCQSGVVAQMKHDRLVNWIVDVLLRYMRKVMSRNRAMGLKVDTVDRLSYHLPMEKRAWTRLSKS